MTLDSCIQSVDEIKPNAFSNETKTKWINEVEGMVQTEVFLIFQSTLPARGATFCTFCQLKTRTNFNPRSPRGERQQNVLKYRREFWVKRQLIKQNWET